MHPLSFTFFTYLSLCIQSTRESTLKLSPHVVFSISVKFKFIFPVHRPEPWTSLFLSNISTLPSKYIWNLTIFYRVYGFHYLSELISSCSPIFHYAPCILAPLPIQELAQHFAFGLYACSFLCLEHSPQVSAWLTIWLVSSSFKSLFQSHLSWPLSLKLQASQYSLTYVLFCFIFTHEKKSPFNIWYDFHIFLTACLPLLEWKFYVGRKCYQFVHCYIPAAWNNAGILTGSKQ